MKKGLIAILAILYMTITSGIVVNVHYCMGRIASVEYGYDDHGQCGKCGMSTKKKGCCHTEYKLVKLADEHQWVKSQVAFLQIPAEVPVHYPVVPVSLQANATHLFPPYHAPPDQRLNKVYASNCVFRI